MELKYSVQNYDWGKVGSHSKVAQLIKSNGGAIDESKNYAELWLGTHFSGPSYLIRKNHEPENLNDWIQKNPNSLGESVVLEYNGKLPYLMKILSVAKALSIQIHPSKEHAVQLHKQFPNIYKDENHKPELAIALSKFEAFCGFKELTKIRKLLNEVTEIQAILSDSLLNQLSESPNADNVEVFKTIFHTLMTAPQTLVQKQLGCLNERVKQMDCGDITEELQLFSRVYEQFPGDNGCLCVFLFNYICLDIGQSIYIGANEPHAYLNGDCLECMACSDNVVRAGLTPKFKDIPTLCSLLNYQFESPEAKLLVPIIENESSYLYSPPVSDFAVAKIVVQPNTEYNFIIRPSASICLCLSGNGKINENDISPGKAFFISANEKVILTNECNNVLEVYQAFANVR